MGWNLKRLRASKGLSQIQLAADADLNRTYLGQIERAEENTSVDILEKLADVLGCKVRDFFEEPVDGDERPAGLKSGRKTAPA